MTPVRWLLPAALLLVPTSAVIAQRATTAPQAPPAMKPVASTKQIMQAMVAPSSKILFEAVSTVQTQTGTVERAPKTDEEWATVEHAAVMVAEAGNLLMMGRRAQDRGRWMRMSLEMTEAAAVALKAVEAKDASALFLSGERIYDACDACHARYQPSQK